MGPLRPLGLLGLPLCCYADSVPFVLSVLFVVFVLLVVFSARDALAPLYSSYALSFDPLGVVI